MVAVGDLDVERVAFSEVDGGVAVRGVEEPDLAVGRSRWRCADASGQLQVGIAPAGVGRGGDAPIDRVVVAGGAAVLTRSGVCVFHLDVVARGQDQFAAVVCKVRTAGGCDQGILEDSSVDASLRQDDLFNLTGGGVGDLDCQGLSHRAVFVLVAISHTQADVVGTGPVAGHGFDEARVHQEHFAIGHCHGNLGLVDFVLLNARAIHGHAVGDGVVTVGQRLVDGAPDRDPVANFHHAAALESVGHGGSAGVQIGDAETCPSQGESHASQAAVVDRTRDGHPIGGIESLRGPGNRPGPFALGRVDRHQGAVGHVFGTVGRRDGVLEHDVIEIDHSPVGQGHRVGDLFAQFNDRVVVAGSSHHQGSGFSRRLAQDIVRKGCDGRTHVQVGGTGSGDRGVFTPGGGDQGAVLGVRRQTGLVFVSVKQAVGLQAFDGVLVSAGAAVLRLGDGVAGRILHRHRRTVDVEHRVCGRRDPHRAGIEVGAGEGACEVVGAGAPAHHKLVAQVGLGHQGVGPVVGLVGRGICVDDTHRIELFEAPIGVCVGGVKPRRRRWHQEIRGLGGAVGCPGGATGTRGGDGASASGRFVPDVGTMGVVDQHIGRIGRQSGAHRGVIAARPLLIGGEGKPAVFIAGANIASDQVNADALVRSDLCARIEPATDHITLALVEGNGQVDRAIAVLVHRHGGVVLGGDDVRGGVLKQLVGAPGHRLDVLPHRQGVGLASV